MSQLKVITTEIQPDIAARHTFTSNTAHSQLTTSIQGFSYPIIVEGDKIRIYGDLVSPERYYPFSYKEKDYLLYKPKEGTMEIYEVADES